MPSSSPSSRTSCSSSSRRPGSRPLREFVSFIGARLATGVIEWFGVPYFSTHGLTHPLFGVKGLLAKVVVSIVVIILNYIFSKFLVFIKKDKPEN